MKSALQDTLHTLQVGPRGERERAFYETIAEELKAEQEQLGSGFIHPSVPEAGETVQRPQRLLAFGGQVNILPRTWPAITTA